VFTILSFIAFYFFISKRAGQANFRIIGLILSIIIAILMAIFSFSIEVLSLGVINTCYVFLNGYGIYNCFKEIKLNRQEKISEI
ncbi:MAG: hypothetical protein ACFFC1_05480, partial [Promethearchaeota archaeon]